MPEPATKPLVDAHHHLWNLRRHRQLWLEAPQHTVLRRSFDMQDLRETATRPIAGHRLARTVLVQAIASVPETRDLLAAAEDDEQIGAVVGWVDLTSPTVGAQLDELLHALGGHHLKAIRHLVQDEADPAWLQRPETERGLTALTERDLGYDLLIRSHQFEQAIRLAERLPELRLVLDHAGKPPIARGDLNDWERQIRRLASHPNVMCKLSGLVTEADHEHWSVTDLRPVWNALADAFGASRLMFGSDWPVCNLAGGWNRWAEAAEQLLEPLRPDEADAMLAGSAADFYRLELPETAPEPRKQTCC